MDRLTFFVASHHLTVRLQRLSLHPDLWKQGTIMTPKMRGALQALDMLKHDCETDADEIVAHVADLQSRRKAAKTRTQGALNQVGGVLGDIEDFVGALEGSNGAPSLDGSKTSSDASGAATTQSDSSATASAETEQTTAAAAADQKLTVNGVQA